MNRHPNTNGRGMKGIPPGCSIGNFMDLMQSKEGPRPKKIAAGVLRINGKPCKVRIFASVPLAEEDFYRIYRHPLRAHGQP